MKKIKSASVTPMTPVAVFFTLASLAWTGYSVTDLMAAGPWGLLAAVSVDGLWGVVQFLDYKGIGGRTVRNFGWVALACASGLLAYHGSTINPAAAIAGSLPPIVAKAAWLGDIRLRRDPTALTPGQESEINDVIRDSEYIARMKAAQIRRDAAEEIALVQAQADVTLARDEADFMVGLERLRKRAELERRRPLQLSPAEPHPEPERPEPAAPLPLELPTKPRKTPPPHEPEGPEGDPVEDVDALFGDAHAPIVYFLRNGSRVKIGTSQNLKRRVGALSLRREDVIRVEHGGQRHERSLHRRFADLRAGDTEWFELSGELARYLLSVEPTAQSSEPEAHSPESGGSTLPMMLASSLATAPEPPAHPVEPEARSFGFSAQVTAQSAQRAQSVARVVELLAQDSGLTSGQVAETLDVSPATAKRYLREARTGGHS